MNTSSPTIAVNVIDPNPHAVYQRNERNTATLPIRFRLSTSVTGDVEARFVSDTVGGTEWITIGHVNGTEFDGVLHEAPVGRYRVDVRISASPAGSSAATVAAFSVEPVFVGDLWIMAGQSNMEGCGKLIDFESPQEGVSCFYLGDRWAIAEDPLCWLNDSIDPVHRITPTPQHPEIGDTIARHNRSKGASLGVPFAKELLRHTGVPVGLIMCAHGGTSMEQWDRERPGDIGTTLYSAMMRKVRKLGGKVKGCLWYQGESDANEQAAPFYRERTKSFVEALRRDMGDPGLPFVYAQLSIVYAWGRGPESWDFIREEQRLMENELGCAAIVPTIDATLSDAIHLDAPSLREVGKRMAWRALSIAYGIEAAKPGPRPCGFEWNGDRTLLQVALSGVNGRLSHPAGNPFGFAADHSGTPLPITVDISAEGDGLLIRFERSAPDGTRLWHGNGLNPAVNIKDERGIPLLAFGPIPV
ncbi:MAG: hypothetical protein K0R28_2800 [Paenibacillus sp.]|nr:hypothetical protein [Paenibacillus sp.]